MYNIFDVNISHINKECKSQVEEALMLVSLFSKDQDSKTKLTSKIISKLPSSFAISLWLRDSKGKLKRCHINHLSVSNASIIPSCKDSLTYFKHQTKLKGFLVFGADVYPCNFTIQKVKEMAPTSKEIEIYLQNYATEVFSQDSCIFEETTLEKKKERSGIDYTSFKNTKLSY